MMQKEVLYFYKLSHLPMTLISLLKS